MTQLQDLSLTDLKGVGSKLAEKFHSLGIYSLQDLLFHLPFRYEDRTRIKALSHFRAGESGLFEAEVVNNNVVFGRRRSLEISVRDDTGMVVMRFYHFSAAQSQQLQRGARLRAFGEARRGRSGLEFYHPEYQILKGDVDLEVPETLTPIYPTTEGIQQPRIRKLMTQALSWLRRHQVTDLLPANVRAEYQLPELKQALLYLHSPPTDANQYLLLEGKHPFQQRLAMEELLAHNLSLQLLRLKTKSNQTLSCTGEDSLSPKLLAQLPFALTNAQQQVLSEIRRDLQSHMPMLRLVQGDVGSGKTVVAALAALQMVASGGQVAMMAPTEILAEQHFASFSSWLEPLGIKLAWLSGKTKGKSRQQALESIKNGTAQVIVGTHALFQDEVEYARLGLAIIDEQHRFGVHQRLALKNKGGAARIVPHQLIMTATPIPRTLAMSAYADLDTSVIDELPPGRQPIETFVLPDTRREEIVERIKLSCERGAQAYWVCTLIEESEALQCQAAEDAAAWLQESLPNLLVGLVHGRMKPAEKSLVMEQFKNGKIDLLVATTVIEVGVDVPNASLIVIENPERLGLAQLHQLRGRVGRGEAKSYCALLYHSPLSQNGKARLQVMRDSNDGFVIAEKDLEIRGPGEVLGTKQTGLVDFKMADLQRDKEWLPHIQKIASEVVKDSSLTKALIDRWIGERQQYGEV